MNSFNTTPLHKERLASLDILRGFDLFMLVFFQPVFVAFAKLWSDVPLFSFFSQFTSPTFTEFTASYKDLQLSMDGKGRAIDNIFIERFWRNLKYEKIYLEPSSNGLELYHKIKDYMKFYNAERPHQSLEYKTPEQIYLLVA